MAQTVGMTPKQQEVFDLTQELGQDAKAIAARIGTSENNVHGHLRRLRAHGHLSERAAGSNGGTRARAQRAAEPVPPGRTPDRREPESERTTLLDDIEQAAGHFRDAMETKLHELDARLKQNAVEREEFIARSDAERNALTIGRERLAARLDALAKADASA